MLPARRGRQGESASDRSGQGARGRAVRLADHHRRRGRGLPEHRLQAALLDSLATEVVRVRIDFTQYAEAYYFHDGEDHSSLAAILGYAVALARQGQAARRPDVRLTGDVLAGALDDLATILDQRFLHTGGTTTEVFAAYAVDHDRNVTQS